MKNYTFEIVELDTVATGLRIKQLMATRNVSAREVSNKMKVSPQAVYRWQNGEAMPTVNNIYILGQLLHTGVDDLLVAKQK